MCSVLLNVGKVREAGSEQTLRVSATISTHPLHFASSFPLTVASGVRHHVSSPRVVACGRASRFPRQNVTRWGFLVSRSQSPRKWSGYVPPVLTGQSKGLFCLVQVKGGAVFGNPILFGTPLLYLCMVQSRQPAPSAANPFV